MVPQTQQQPRTPILPAPSNVNDMAGAQLGGSCCQASLPVVETPTRLWSCIKPMECDTGVVQQAGWCRAQLLGKESPPPLVTPPPSPVADALVPPPIVAHPGPALFSPPPLLEPVASGSVIIPPTIQNVAAVLLASDMPVDANIDPMLLAESTPFTRDANASIDPMLLT